MNQSSMKVAPIYRGLQLIVEEKVSDARVAIGELICLLLEERHMLGSQGLSEVEAFAHSLRKDSDRLIRILEGLR